MSKSLLRSMLSPFTYKKDVDFIKKCFELYKRNINVKNNWIIKPIYTDVDELNSILEMDRLELKENNIKLYFTKNYLNLSDFDKRIKLFHEFTHIFDILTCNIQEELKSSFIMYSEYHAEKVCLSMTYNDSDKKYEKKILNILNNQLKQATVYFNCKNIFWRDKTPEQIAIYFKQAILHTWYFMGQISFYYEYMNIITMPNFSIFNDFSDDMLKIYYIFLKYEQTHNENELKILEEIYKRVQNEFFHKTINAKLNQS